MNVLFIQLTTYGMMSYGLLSLADSLRDTKHNVRIMGTGAGVRHLLEDGSHHDLFKRRAREFAPDIIGISAMTPDADLIEPVAAVCRKLFPDAVITCGGYHMLVFGTKVLEENPTLDFGSIGESEESFPLFLDVLASGKKNFEDVPGLVYRKDGEIHANKLPKGADFENIIPHRAFREMTDLEILGTTKPSPFRSHQPMLMPNIPFLLVRGCPYKCTFCQMYPKNPYPKLRFVSPESFKRQLDYVQETWSPRSIFINDASFDLNKDWGREIFGIIKERKEIIEWSCYVRPNHMSTDYYKEMRDARCSLMLLYLEGGTDRVRNDILKKQVSDKDLREAFSYAHELGIFLRTSMIVGNPTETIEELENGIRFLGELNPHTAVFPCLTIIPGTELWDKYNKDMVIESYKDFDIGSCGKNLLREDLKVNFSEIEPTTVLNKKATVSVHYNTLGTILRSKVDVADKRVLFMQSGPGDRLYHTLGSLFLKENDYGQKSIRLLHDPELHVDDIFITSNVKVTPVQSGPLSLSSDDDLWEELRQEKYDILVSSCVGMDKNTYIRLIELAGLMQIKQVVFVDHENWVIHQYDMKLKAATETRLTCHLQNALVQEPQKKITELEGLLAEKEAELQVLKEALDAKLN